MSPKDEYLLVNSFSDALKVCWRQLEERGKGEITPLISDQMVREAIRTGLRSFVATQKMRTSRNTKDFSPYFTKIVKPVFLAMINENIWIKGAYFDIQEAFVDPVGMHYPSLRIQVVIPGLNKHFSGFAMPVLDLYYGRFFASVDEEKVDDREVEIVEARQSAEDAWHEGDYRKVVRMYEKIELFLLPEEHMKLETARKRGAQSKVQEGG